MYWLKKFPWLSLVLLLATYGVFGWYVEQSKSLWNSWIIEQGRGWGWTIEEDLLGISLYVVSGAVILAITFGLTAPVALLTFFMGSPLKNDVRAMFSVLVWAFAVVIIICWLQFFAHLLLLISAAILGRLALQEWGCKTWQASLIISLLALSSFMVGLFVSSELGR
ncbi:conserved hypothetical protein [Gloeothece citriformis PCC 7424]|uniref:Yip1 domain-containing protein n=1 Tax=Gloeothece citriformis (strain PCC 7424) TaxID=65393 RepID=B7KGI7_GLOC7|nr:hypothetical protein [Gloeothece citriformis]ACK71914.1 conserved hypothetical protein [Gloeothece citriformis PCC 7424]